MKKLILSITMSMFALILFAQPSQTVRGTVVDSESQYPLIGVNVLLVDQNGMQKGVTTDLDGVFRIENVPVGRAALTFTYLGYDQYDIPDLIVNSGKENILDIKMGESFETIEEVVVVASKTGEVVNDMAIVSAREFSVQETNRYAGSRGEPARMASNFAGVQGADDSRNDIIIRGNSPQGVLWRLDGINIPNPNHFSIPGTGGGPVTILNNKFLANSDFFTGAFPAEYGNSMAGVFDLRMRNGNNEKHEFSGQLGFLGTELMAEGPLGNSKASYLATYRYSTLSLFGFLGVNIGTDAVPAYQDGAFRFNFPFKNGGNLAIFGIGGTSSVDIRISEEIEPDTTTLIFGSNDRDQLFSSRMGLVGATYTQPLDENTFVKLGIAASHSQIKADHNYIYRRVVDGQFVVDSLPQVLDYTFTENKYSAYGYMNKKFNPRLSMKTGINLDAFDVNYQDRVRIVSFEETSPGVEEAVLAPWGTRWNSEDLSFLVQPYIQFKYRASQKLTLTGGVTALYYSINENSLSPFEPRLGLAYQIDEKQKLSLGLGMHSQTQSNYLYFYGDPVGDGTVDTYNLDMGLSRNNHIVAGYDLSIGRGMRFKFETYYQYLTNIPVDPLVGGFSIINSGSGFSRLFPDELENTGVGQNYGAEFTLEKFFSKGYYFLVTTSLFDSKYRGSDDVWRNTVFNGNYAVNTLFAKEIKFERSSLNFGGKVTFAGGRRAGTVDVPASRAAQEIVFLTDENLFEERFRPYFRADAKVNYRFNTNKLTHEIAVDFVNIFNTKNILTITYVDDPSVNFQREEFQLGFLPLFYYRIDF